MLYYEEDYERKSNAVCCCWPEDGEWEIQCSENFFGLHFCPSLVAEELLFLLMPLAGV